MNTLSTRLRSAFNQLRKMGYLAKQNFSCCSNCAGYALTEEAVKKVQAGKTIRGSVFYHAQDAASRDEGDDFYLSYGPLDSTELGQIGIDTEAVGQEVVKVMKENGVIVEWNGSGNTRILVKVEETEKLARLESLGSSPVTNAFSYAMEAATLKRKLA